MGNQAQKSPQQGAVIDFAGIYHILRVVTMRCLALLCDSFRCDALLCIAVRFNAVLCLAVRCLALLCVAFQCPALRHLNNY